MFKVCKFQDSFGKYHYGMEYRLFNNKYYFSFIAYYFYTPIRNIMFTGFVIYELSNTFEYWFDLISKTLK